MVWKVLIVEDDRTTINIMESFVFPRDPRFTPIFAASIEEAQEAFAEHTDIVGISLDGQVISEFPVVFGESNTLGLAKEFRKTFSGPIIAASNGFNHDLVLAGCSHQVQDKFDVCKKFSEIFSISPPLLLETSHGKKTAL